MLNLIHIHIQVNEVPQETHMWAIVLSHYRLRQWLAKSNVFLYCIEIIRVFFSTYLFTRQIPNVFIIAWATGQRFSMLLLQLLPYHQDDSLYLALKYYSFITTRRSFITLGRPTLRDTCVHLVLQQDSAYAVGSHSYTRTSGTRRYFLLRYSNWWEEFILGVPCLVFYMTPPELTKLQEVIDSRSTLKETYSTVNTVLAENLARLGSLATAGKWPKRYFVMLEVSIFTSDYCPRCSLHAGDFSICVSKGRP